MINTFLLLFSPDFYIHSLVDMPHYAQNFIQEETIRP